MAMGPSYEHDHLCPQCGDWYRCEDEDCETAEDDKVCPDCDWDNGPGGVD